ncbi:phosphomethylpyrimidine synthase ThiC [Advenella kashmirensis WT001]|uniref:Phosphomethylpyrimidine synthase ThiC n=1 Tax=Advenella kashmirensis (strain DSM 17095 / LMG 22695 / WT001) TaxID=1036672 RepID=I3U9I7_ADVKW|nr:phosphomethylpyrimidine synthase ThiC [Advenella kashmirensis WT001]
MSANPKFLAATAQVDSAAIQALPQSRKIYEQGSRPDIRVPFREISQDDTPTLFGGESNPPLTVYDASGPYTDPTVNIDIRKGCPRFGAPGSTNGRIQKCCPAPVVSMGRNA